MVLMVDFFFNKLNINTLKQIKSNFILDWFGGKEKVEGYNMTYENKSRMLNLENESNTATLNLWNNFSVYHSLGWDIVDFFS